MFYGHSTENRDYNVADGITDIAGNDTEQDLKGNLTEFEMLFGYETNNFTIIIVGLFFEGCIM